MKIKSTSMNKPQTSTAGMGKTAETQLQHVKPDQKLGILAAVGAVVLWSTSFAATKIGITGVPPLTFAAIRFLIASILMGGLTGIGMHLEPVSRKDLRELALGGFLGITAIFSLHNLGMQSTTSADANLLVASYPVITLLLEILLFKARLNYKQLAGVALAIGGVYLVINLTSEQSASNRLVGNLLILSAGFIWAFYNFVTQNVVRHYATFTVIFWQTLFGTVMLITLSLTETSRWQSPSIPALLAATFLGIFCSVGAYLLYGYSLKSLPPGLAVNLMNLQPVFGLIFAAILLGEHIALIQIIGGIILVTGVTVSLRFGLNRQ